MSQCTFGTFRQLAPANCANIRELLAPEVDPTRPRYFGGPGVSHGALSHSPSATRPSSSCTSLPPSTAPTCSMAPPSRRSPAGPTSVLASRSCPTRRYRRDVADHDPARPLGAGVLTDFHCTDGFSAHSVPCCTTTGAANVGCQAGLYWTRTYSVLGQRGRTGQWCHDRRDMRECLDGGCLEECWLPRAAVCWRLAARLHNQRPPSQG